ncbi:succinate--CoA ligase subunit alpha [bacterium]|nr:succinate--CoA ligase subunit alpha [bacterium]
MAILVDENTKLVVQGITGRDGSFHTKQMIDYGTNVVAGVTPGKGGQSIHDVPVFDTMKEAVEGTGANTSVIYVPAKFATDAVFEAADSGVKLIICIAEGVPTQDMAKVTSYLKCKGVRLIGPNSPGVTSPGYCKVGIMPGQIFEKGTIGIVSRSGTLTYEVVHAITQAGMGQSTCLGIGGDQIIGSNFIDILELFREDAQTEGVALIGEIGGTAEEETAEYIKARFNKPVVAFIAGRTAPPGKRMGHAGAIISGGSGTAEDKIKAFEAVGVPVAEIPAQMADLMKEKLNK